MGLSVASRSTQDLFLSSQQTESSRVFNAAEAGIEDALSADLNFQGNQSTGSITSIADTEVEYQIDKLSYLETRIFEGTSVQIDVDDSGAGTGLTSDQLLRIDWSKISDCNQDPASIIVSIFYIDGFQVRARYNGYASCDRGDGFIMGNDGTAPYFRRRNIQLLAGDLFVRIKVVYNDTDILVRGNGWTPPTQSYRILSEAKNELGNETRAVEVKRTLDSAPAIMDYALFSGKTIVK